MTTERDDNAGDAASDPRTPEEATRPGAYAIPAPSTRKRLSPALDPVARMRVSQTAKWLLVSGILIFLLGAPLFYHTAEPSDDQLNALRQSVSKEKTALARLTKQSVRGGRRAESDSGDGPGLEQRKVELENQEAELEKAQTSFDAQRSAARRSSLIDVFASAVLAAALATGLPRLLLPRAFGKWEEPVEAIRDWLIVGLITGFLYLVIVAGLHLIKASPNNDFLSNLVNLRDAVNMTFDPVWLKFRLPIILGCALVGLTVARRTALHAAGIAASGAAKLGGELVMQALILGALIRPIERTFASLSAKAFGGALVGLSLLLILAAVAIIYWAYDTDRHALSLHQRGHPALTGLDAGGERPVPMTLSIIGGRDSGKTVLMAAAYYEWLLKPFGQLRIKPSANPSTLNQGAFGYSAGHAAGGTNLEQVAEELYGNNQFPIGTVSTQNLPFDIAFGREVVSQFSMLDFPGGAVVGRAADQAIVQQFWERLDNSDALMIIADMSYVRRGRKDPGFTQVFGAYVDAMHRLIDRNGKRRVVPIALMLTKCDEYFDPSLGRLNMDAIQQGLEEFGYTGLEATWRQMCAQAGQPIVEFETWLTSAITFSQPQVDADGGEDYTKPYRIVPPPPPITPTTCAAPVLWLTSKVMRWNITAFRDLSSFLFGGTVRQRLRIQSVLEMERVAEEYRHG